MENERKIKCYIEENGIYLKVNDASNDFNYTCKIDREEFKNAIDRISIFSPKVDETNYSIIVLNIKNNNMEITSSNSQIGNAQENLDCQFEGEIKIACSSQY